MDSKSKVLNALRVIYEAADGDMTQVPRGYLEALDCEYSDGDLCTISEFSENIQTFDSFEDFSEYVAPLVKGTPNEQSFDLSFAEGDDEAMLKKVIGTIYLDGVANVSDVNKKRLSEANNYGFNPQKGGWEGYFQGEDGTVFSYNIMKGKSGKWQIEYKVAQ